MNLLVRALKEFGFHDTHKVGETLHIPLEHINGLIQEGFVEIVVNNMGNNKSYDESEECPFIELDAIEAGGTRHGI